MRSSSARRRWRSCTSGSGTPSASSTFPGYPAPAHPSDDRRGGHHAGDRHLRGAPHLHGDRCRRARRRGASDREPGSPGLRRTVHRSQHGPLACPGRPRYATGPGRRATAQRDGERHPGAAGSRIRTAAGTKPASSPSSTRPRSPTTAPWARPRCSWPPRLAVAAVVAVGLALAASVRRCRRDLALLRVMGFVERQLSAAVAWHASVTATVGVVIGIPLGIVLGRWLWTLFADEIGAVPGTDGSRVVDRDRRGRRAGPGQRRRRAPRAAGAHTAAALVLQDE